MNSADFLQRMAESSRSRALALHNGSDARVFAQRITTQPSLLFPDFNKPGFDVIAEVKRRSPAAGMLSAQGDSITDRAQLYQDSGAIAVSVLTEPNAFAGDISDLSAVANAISCPVMRKDFLVDPIQVHEARASGASGVLLIVRMLDETTMQRMLEAAVELHMFTLLEIFAANDVPALERALDSAARCGAVAYPGVNCRDLSTLEVNPQQHADLLRMMPGGVPVVAESGVASAVDVVRLAELGYRAALIGTALMQAREPDETLRSFLSAGRGAALARSST